MHVFEVEARNGDIPVDYNQQAFFFLASFYTRVFLTQLLPGFYTDLLQ